jgi:mono/diheme cytochrome c family protein
MGLPFSGQGCRRSADLESCMKRVVLALVVLVLAGAGLFWFLTSPDRDTTGLEPVAEGPPDLANGQVVFHASGCESCHATPGQDDKTRLGGGAPLRSPFGTFYPPNISPHKEDGIGSWTLAQFQRAMRGGVSPDGTHLYPAFPYTSYQRMTATDLRDLFGFIMTLPAVAGRTRDHDLPFPLTIRRGIGLWKLAFLDGAVFRPDPARDATWNRGAYLVEGPGHCAECHSPRNIFGAIPDDRRFAGGPNPEGKGSVPNLTPDPSGLKDWTKSDIEEVLASGMTPEGDFVGSNMAAVVEHTSKLPEADRAAIAEYIKSLPPRPSASKQAK